MKKGRRLTASCALIFATFPGLYYGAVVVSEPTVTTVALGVLAVAVALALTT